MPPRRAADEAKGAERELSPAELAQKAAVEKAKEADTYRVKLAGFMAQPHIQNKPKRTGWTKVKEGYKPCLWDNDCFDWTAILSIFIFMYGSEALFYWGMLTFYLETDVDKAALWFNVVLFAVGVTLLALFVYRGQKAKQAREAAEAALKRDMAVNALEAAQH